MTRFLFFHAKRRARPERPFFVYLDECHRYLSGDLENLLAESRKYGVAAVLSHQWLEQAATEGDNMLAAIRNATNVKVVFRIKDPKEAEELAHTVVPLNLEMPVQALTSPTVVGHRHIRLASESESEQTANTRSMTETIGESESHSESYATMRATTRAETTTAAELESLGTSAGTSRTFASSIGTSAISTQMLAPVSGLFNAPTVIGISEGIGSSAQTSEAMGAGASVTRGRGSSRSNGSSTATMIATTHGESVSRGTHRALSSGLAETHAAGKTRGSAEALEPVLEDRPYQRQSKSPKTIAKERAQDTLFLQLIDSKTPIDEIERTDCRRVQETITRLPANFSRFDIDPRKILDSADALGPKMRAETQNSYLSPFAAIFRYVLNLT